MKEEKYEDFVNKFNINYGNLNRQSQELILEDINRYDLIKNNNNSNITYYIDYANLNNVILPMNILDAKSEYWMNFLLLLGVFHDVLYNSLFKNSNDDINGDNLMVLYDYYIRRKNINLDYFKNDFIYVNDNNISFYDKDSLLFYIDKAYDKKHLNASINTLLGLVNYSISDRFDTNKILNIYDYSMNNLAMGYSKSYELDLAFNLVDLIFDNNIDKLNFLKLYQENTKTLVNIHSHYMNNLFNKSY